jgi:lipopolysaccharide transport system permease protein
VARRFLGTYSIVYLMKSLPLSGQTVLAVGDGHATRPSTVIQATRGWSALGLKEVWQRKELLYFLIVRELQGTHRQTALGLSWVFLRPLIHMALLSVVFGRVVRVPSDGVPYPVFALAALLPWNFFSNAVTKASRSLVDNLHLISKVYFPRILVPTAGASSGVVDFGASFVVLLLVLRYYGMPLRWEMLWLPLLLLTTLAFALAVGFWLATLSVTYRDVSFAIGFLLQALMYASPVIYPVSLVPPSAQFLYQLNPMSAIIGAYRWALLGSGSAPGLEFWLSIALVVAALVSGAFVFRRTERTVVDTL